MAFRFALDSVLKQRKRLEDIAQRDFAEAQAAVDEVLRRLESMYQRQDEVRTEIAQAEAKGSAGSIAMVREMETFINGHKIRIEKVRQEARALLLIAEEKQEALIAAAREKKVLVKLRERRMHEYQDWLRKIEAKNADDQTMMRQAWRKR